MIYEKKQEDFENKGLLGFMKKGTFRNIFIAFAFLLTFISCAANDMKTATWITNPIVNTKERPSLSYMDMKIRALDACGFKNYSPFVVGIDRGMENILFVFYAKDLDSIARVQVNCLTGQTLVAEIRDKVTKNGLDFLKNVDLIIDAETALNLACKREARIPSPTEKTPEYTYSSRFKRFNNVIKAKEEGEEDKTEQVYAFSVIFGTKKFEYSMNIKANVGDNVVLGSARINSRADDKVY